MIGEDVDTVNIKKLDAHDVAKYVYFTFLPLDFPLEAYAVLSRLN